MAYVFDLFGELCSERAGLPGRPEHLPTSENVRKVRALVLAGWKVVAIAAELGVSPPTLRRVYFRDLDRAREEGRLQAKARVVLMLEEQVAAGNVAAGKALLKFIDDEGLRALPKSLKAQPVGKKEARRKSAAVPPSEWADLIPPAPAELN